MAWTLSIRRGDTVRVIAGRDKGKQGRVLSVDPDNATCTVEHAQTIKRHTRPTQSNQTGGIIEKEAGIELSNLMPLTPSGKPTRVSFRVNADGKKVRYSAKHDEYLD